MRTCEARDCFESIDHLRADARFCTEACRVRTWKDRTGYRDPRRGKTVRNGSQRKKRAPDMRVSYKKAREALVAKLWHFPGGEQLVDEALASCLTDKQKEALCGGT